MGLKCAIPPTVIASLLLCAGCQKPMQTPDAVRSGDYGRARVYLYEHITDKRDSRDYLLDRMRVAVMTVADGYPNSAQTVFEQVYDILRTQGINADKTVASVVLNEDIKIWKGEPFEQALAMFYYGVQQAEIGSWDNARAAVQNSLFYLKDFGTDETGRRINTEDIARRSLIYERAIDAGATEQEAKAKVEGGDYIDHGYVPRESNFTLGYLLNAVANQQLGRDDEASDNLRAARAINPLLEPLTAALRQDRYNTVLIVSWGLGPRKEGYGPDKALSRFVPRTRSDSAPLIVRVNGDEGRAYPVVLDVNEMAADHMWNNMEDVRTAKSTIGNVMLVGGAVATGVGANNSSPEAVYAGLGAMAAGAFLKAGAHVDIRYCDVMPQRYYLVPLRITEPQTRIELQVEGKYVSRMVLTGLGPPTNVDRHAQLRYVALVTGRTGSAAAPGWAVAGQPIYGNPRTGPVGDAPLPYILGGNDVQLPSERALDDYQHAGFMYQYTYGDLLELYRSEGITSTVEDERGYAGLHVLEGGKSLVAPLAGTAGFARLFCGEHPHYAPKSALVRDAAKQEQTLQGESP